MNITTDVALPQRSPRPVHLIGESPQARVSTTDGVLIIEPRSLVTRRSIDALDRLLSRVDAPVILDLRHLSHAGRAALHRVDPDHWNRERGSICIVCNRADSTRVCAECDRADPPPVCAAAGGQLAVFGHVPDAIQALVLADVGFGDGWS